MYRSFLIFLMYASINPMEMGKFKDIEVIPTILCRYCLQEGTDKLFLSEKEEQQHIFKEHGIISGEYVFQEYNTELKEEGADDSASDDENSSHRSVDADAQEAGIFQE